MKKFVTLDKTWKEVLYGASASGPSFMMVLLGAYFTDALNQSGLGIDTNPDARFQTFAKAITSVGSGFTAIPLILTALFPIIWMIAKMFDGLIDVPLAHVTDSMKTKWGRRRLPILIAFFPMVISYAMLWLPIFGFTESAQVGNTIWICVMAIIFFTSYTMCQISFYGSLSTVCSSVNQKIKVSSFKAFFDTIGYCTAYALVPLVLSGLKIHIDTLIFCLLPIMCTILIPVFMIKEGDKFEKKAIAEGYDISSITDEKEVSFGESVKLTIKNKVFLRWCVVNSFAYFGLQMFLASMNALIMGGMKMSGGQMAILNSAAFAPVPIMLYLFNKVKTKKGIRFTFQSCLIAFALSILAFDLGSVFFMQQYKDVVAWFLKISKSSTDVNSIYLLNEGKYIIQIIIGIIGGICCSWAIGSFFMMPVVVPSQISSVEEKLTKKNHSAMYFAGQSVFTAIIAAISTGLVYESIKRLFISSSASGIKIADSETLAADAFGVPVDSVYNLGLLLVPVIVAIVSIIGAVLARKLPKWFSPKEISHALGLDAEYEENKQLFSEEENVNEMEEESAGINTALWILSGSIFSIIWMISLNKKHNILTNKKVNMVHSILGFFIPPYYAYTSYKISKNLTEELRNNGVENKDLSILCLIFNILCLNIVSLIILQIKANKLLKVKSAKENEEPLTEAVAQ